MHFFILYFFLTSNYQITCSCKKSDLGNILSLVQSRFDVDQASLKITQLTKVIIHYFFTEFDNHLKWLTGCSE